jgi:hypothetical protein
VNFKCRFTPVENPGEGVPEVFAKIPRGSRVPGKIARGPPILGFIAFLLTSVLKFAKGDLYLPSPSPFYVHL